MTTSASSLLLLLAASCTTAAFEKPEINPMRAWTCHGRNQRQLVDHLYQAKIVQSQPVRNVLYRTDRGNYVPQNPYMDAPQSIGEGQTISAPHMHAHALEDMLPYVLKSKSETLSLLDVGCGSGYLTAAMGRWVHPPNPILGKTGKVYGIDVFPNLVDLTLENMRKNDEDLLLEETVTIQLADGWKGLPDKAPFDAIHVGAAADDFPKALMQQLKVGGVMIIPVGPNGGIQNLYRVEKIEDDTDGKFESRHFKITELLGVRYVPLLHAS